MVERTYQLSCDDISVDMWSAMEDLRNAQTRYRNPLFSIEFAKIMASVREDVKVLIGEDEIGLTFFWPMHISFLRRSRGIGGPFSDRNGPILRDNHYLDIPGLFARNNLESFTTTGLCHTENFESAFFDYIPVNGTDLSGGFEAFYCEKSKEHRSHFKTLKRLERKLDRDFVDVEFRLDDNRPETFQNLIDMKRKQFRATGKHDVLRPEWVSNMLDKLRAQDTDACRTRLSSLYVDGEFVAGELNLQSDDVLHGWIVSYEPRYAKYSPGNLLTLFILESMCAQGITYYDSGIGGDHYKKYITNHLEFVGKGVIYSSARIPTTRQVLAKAWSATEKNVPERMSRLLSRTRRRSEQILSTEVNVASRLRGYYEAINLGISDGFEENT